MRVTTANKAVMAVHFAGRPMAIGTSSTSSRARASRWSRTPRKHSRAASPRAAAGWRDIRRDRGLFVLRDEDDHDRRGRDARHRRPGSWPTARGRCRCTASAATRGTDTRRGDVVLRGRGGGLQVQHDRPRRRDRDGAALVAPMSCSRRAAHSRASTRRGFATSGLVRAGGELPPTSPDGSHAWHLYIVRLNLERLAIDRGGRCASDRSAGIGTSVHFIPLHRHPYYRDTGAPVIAVDIPRGGAGVPARHLPADLAGDDDR